MMSKTRKRLIGGVLVCAVLLAAGTFSVASAQEGAKAAVCTPAMVASTPIIPVISMDNDVHEQMYLTYLVKEYAPDSLAGWQRAFADRNQALKTQEEKAVPVVESVPAAMGSTVESSSANAKGLPSGKDSIKAAETVPALEAADKIDPALDAKIKAQIKLSEDFAKAVANKDAKAIASLLPKVLDDYKNTTASLKIATH